MNYLHSIFRLRCRWSFVFISLSDVNPADELPAEFDKTTAKYLGANILQIKIGFVSFSDRFVAVC